MVIDQPGCAPGFASLTTGATPAQRRGMAFRALVIATLILVLFALPGEQLLDTLGITLDAFRVLGTPSEGIKVLTIP